MASPRSRRAGAALSLKARALQWLAQREHSRIELRAKLLRAVGRQARAADAPALARAEAADDAVAPDPDGDVQQAEVQQAAEEIDRLLDTLERDGCLSDTRFAESRVRVRSARLGAARIVQELRQHGITLEGEAALALRASEFERALEVWRRKFGAAVRPADASGQARQMRFLLGRGFSAEVARRVLRTAEQPAE